MGFSGFTSTCPCGTGLLYDACCGRLHRGAAVAETAEELMRSRFAAYAMEDSDYLFRTWHPRTRPAELRPTPELTWLDLEIVDTVAGGVAEDLGIVEFSAHFRTDDGDAVLHERSRFTRRGGNWVYVDGDVI